MSGGGIDFLVIPWLKFLGYPMFEISWFSHVWEMLSSDELFPLCEGHPGATLDGEVKPVWKKTTMWSPVGVLLLQEVSGFLVLLHIYISNIYIYIYHIYIYICTYHKNIYLYIYHIYILNIIYIYISYIILYIYTLYFFFYIIYYIL